MQVNGHKLSLSTILSVIGMVAALAGSWFVWGQQAGELRQRVTTVEERQKEDRKVLREDQKEIKGDLKEVKSEVQQIRILLEQLKRGQR